MANTRLRVEAFAMFVGSTVWHPIVNADTMTSACGIDFRKWPEHTYEVRPAHNSTTIERCTICRSEIRTTIPATVALRG